MRRRGIRSSRSTGRCLGSTRRWAGWGAPEAVEEERGHPFEPFNRAMFSFNEKFDQWLLKPVARGYDWVMPDIVMQGGGNFLHHLVHPRIAVNDLLQGKF